MGNKWGILEVMWLKHCIIIILIPFFFIVFSIFTFIESNLNNTIEIDI